MTALWLIGGVGCALALLAYVALVISFSEWRDRRAGRVRLPDAGDYQLSLIHI